MKLRNHLSWIFFALGVAQASWAGTRPSLLHQLPDTARMPAKSPAARAWKSWFFGPASGKAAAEAALRNWLRRQPNDTAALFARMVMAASNGQQIQASRSALALLRLAPNDPATEWAARYLSAHLGAQGKLLTEARPEIEHLLRGPLRDPVTAYMLARVGGDLAHAPGKTVWRAQDWLAHSGRIQNWKLYGPFGNWSNLAYGRSYSVASVLHGPYQWNHHPRPGIAYNALRGAVQFPLDWGSRGAGYAITYLRAERSATVLFRIFSPASLQIWINGRRIIANDRRASYRPDAADAAVRLHAGWNRVVVKLAGEGERNFSLIARELNGQPLDSSSSLPAGQKLAGAARLLPPPATLAGWCAAQLRRQAANPLALWLDASWRMEDGDAVGAKHQLSQAARLAPQATPIWLALAQTDQHLPDAGPGWSAAQALAAARHALQADPQALPAELRLAEVRQSQGKTGAAARAYSRCTGHGYAPCDWEAFHLYLGQHWRTEAALALRNALAETPSNWEGLTAGLAFYSRTGQARRAARLTRQLLADPRATPYLGLYDLRHGHPRQAARLLRRAIRWDPASPVLRQQLILALIQAGEALPAQRAARAALAACPHNWRIARAAASAFDLAQGSSASLAWLQRHDHRKPALRWLRSFVANRRFWLPWYHSARQILAHAPGTAQYPNASSILVFDQMVDRIHRDGSRDAYIHQIFRVLDKTGIARHGTVHIPRNSDLLTVRTIEPNGRVLLPERIPNLASITMPGLEPGDYIETAYVEHFPPSPIVARAIDNDMFFVFNSNTEPYNYSDYVVLTPHHDPVAIEQARFPGQPTVTRLPRYTAREWLVQKTRMVLSEPDMPPVQEVVPKVWISSPLEWRQVSMYWTDHLFAVRRVTPAIQAKARHLAAAGSSPTAKADAIFQWVAGHIRSGPGGAFVPAEQYFHNRAGNRLSVFLALLSAARVPWQLVMARPVTDHSSLQIPNLASFSYPLVRVGSRGKREWYDINQPFSQLGYLAPGIRGGQALIVGDDQPHPFITAPTAASTLDATVLQVRAKVNAQGAARLTMSLQFRGVTAEQVREALEGQPASRLPQVYQQLLLGTYPDGVATGGKILHLHHRAPTLTLQIQGEVPDFIRITGQTWEIHRLTGAVNLQRKLASLAYRRYPLIIGGGMVEQARVSVQLPPQLAQLQLPAGANLVSSFGTFTTQYSETGGVLRFQRGLSLPAERINASQYPDFRRFAEQVTAADHTHIFGQVKSQLPPQG